MIIYQLLAWICVSLIAVLSLVPGAERPNSSLPGQAEHFVAYAATGLFFALGYTSPRVRVIGWIGLAVASGVFELLQNLVPGRTPSALDALASTMGLTAGLGSGALISATWAPVRSL